MSACGSSDGELLSITIVAPTDGARLTPADDQDPATPGVQIDVLAQVSGIASSNAIALSIDRAQVAISAANRSGDLVFANVTLPPGRHELLVRTVSGSVQSVAAQYTLLGLSITDPRDGTTLSARDDEDPVAPDMQLSVDVQSYGLELTDTIALRIDDVEVTTLNPEANGSARFIGQTLTPGVHTLQAAAGELVSEPITIRVSEPCPRVDLVSPRLPANNQPLLLGPSNDTLGPSCGEEFAIDVVAATDAGDGSSLTLLVNGSARATTTVAGTVARFDGVVLGNRGSLPNRIAFETEYDGTTCRNEFDTDLLVDCAGASCEITSPAAQTYLGSSFDRSLADGFQGEFQVTTDLTAIGQSVLLIIDGDVINAQRTLPSARASSAVATFSVGLSEGAHRMMALCTDDAGNYTMSGEAFWTIDTEACGVTLTAPRQGASFLETDDVDSLDGTQIDLMASVVGNDCERARGGICGGLAGLPFLPISGTTPVARITLATSATQSICFEVSDRAGNLSQAQSQVFYVSDAPRVSIRVPTHGSRFNVLGNDQGSVSYLPDLLPLTAACDVAFEVLCSDLETDVTLHEYVSGAAIPNAVAACDPATTPTTEYPGVARFEHVALPRLGTVALLAQQVAVGGRLVGASSPITVTEDCSAPTLTISSGTESLCDTVLGPSVDDPTRITRDITVTSDDTVNVRQVRLRVVPTSGGAPIADLTDSQAPFEFDNVNFSVFGAHNLVIDARDQAGNAAIVPSCMVSVIDAPAIALAVTESADLDDVIEGEDDCSNDPGLQIEIRGTTDAPQGTPVTLQVGGITVNRSVLCAGEACSFTACVDASQGQVLVRAQITAPDRPTTGVVEREFVIDSLPPLTAIDDLFATAATTTALRAGDVTFRWTDVADQGDIALTSYLLRCASAPISDESDWDAATPLTIELSPGSAGAQRSFSVGGFALYETRHCTLRGSDLGGALTPLNGTNNAVVDFLGLNSHTIAGGSDEGLGRALAAVGDINGDGFADFLVGGLGNARVYFGQSDLTSAARTLTIVGPGDAFGETVAGLGDINGDNRPDFAVGEPDAGIVYVFLGRNERGAGADPMWPAQLDALIDTPLTLTSAEADRFGHAISGLGDFNDDGFADFAVSAPHHDTDAGRVHLVLGRPLCSTDLTSHCLLLGSTTALGDSGGNVDGFVIHGDPGMHLGSSLAALGDLNNDAHDDVALGALGSIADAVDAALVLTAGRTYADVDNGIVALEFDTLTQIRLGAPEQAGHALAALHSEDGARLAITRNNQVTIASVSDPFGAPQFSDELHVLNDLGDASDEFGFSLASGFVPALAPLHCDVDHDGLDELWVGSAGRGNAPGASEMFYRARLRAALDVNQQALRSNAALVNVASAGPTRVACVGDLNGDGEVELVSSDAADGEGSGVITLFY